MSTLTAPVAMTAGSANQSRRMRCVACDRTDDPSEPVMPAEPSVRPFDLFRCPHCGLVQQHPRYTAEQIAALYQNDYYVFAEDEPQRWARAVQQYVLHLLRHEKDHRQRLLDVGSALGHFSALAATRGWRATGIDFSPEAVSRAAARFGLEFRAGTLAQFRGTLAPFDAAFLGDVIEHVPRPDLFLAEVRDALTPGGLVCIDTPNWGSRWRRFGRRRWIGLNEFHVNLFDAGSLSELLRASGFGGIRLGSYTHFRYESWDSRPELQPLVARLPRWLAWRVNRRLARRGRRKPWAALRADPPGTLEESAGMVAASTNLSTLFDDAGLAADNLVAVARRA